MPKSEAQIAALVVRMSLGSSMLVAACASDDVTHVPAPGALGPYSGAVVAGGFVFASGKIGSQRSGSFAEEAASAIDSVSEELARSGLELDDVVSVTVYLTNMDDYAALNEVYAARFPAPHPARTCVAVAALPAGARVEITVVAVAETR